MSTERPILFSAPMVRAILEGRKTQTRRIVKPSRRGSSVYFSPDNKVMMEYREGWGGYELTCPYGKAGDRLWVRETWKIVGWDEDSGELTLRYPATNAEDITVELDETIDPFGELFDKYWQQSCDDMAAAGVEIEPDENYHWEDPTTIPTRHRPSIHMHRWASRILLEVVSVRVERLDSISRQDALAEGVTVDNDLPLDPRDTYRVLWNSINGKGSWDANPWVWVVEFKNVTR